MKEKVRIGTKVLNGEHKPIYATDAEIKEMTTNCIECNKEIFKDCGVHTKYGIVCVECHKHW